LQFAEAAVSLGVDRGIRGFVRYQLLKRRGDSYVALPAAHFQVRERREADLLEELNPLLTQMDGFQRRAQSTPARFHSCRRAIDKAIYDFAVEGGAIRLKAILASLGRMEQYFASQDPSNPKLKRPLSGISPAWIAAADDGSLEVRIAAALASIGPTGEVGPLRANLAPVDPGRPWVWSVGRGQTAWMDHLLLICRQALDSLEQLAIDRLISLWQPDGKPDIRCVPLRWGNLEDLLRPAREWISVTPFVPPRHYRHGRGALAEWLTNELIRECSNHGLPAPESVRPMGRAWLQGGRSFRWMEFRRNRKGDPSRVGYGFQLKFAEPVSGPFALGYGCHFGLGQFCAVLE
jgi:hypothetical protein